MLFQKSIMVLHKESVAIVPRLGTTTLFYKRRLHVTLLLILEITFLLPGFSTVTVVNFKVS